MTKRYTEDHPDVKEWRQAMAQWHADCRDARYVKVPMRKGKHFIIHGHEDGTWFELERDDFAPERDEGDTVSKREIFGFEPVSPAAYSYAFRTESAADNHELIRHAKRIPYIEARAKMAGLDEYIAARCITFGEDIIPCVGPTEFVFYASRLRGRLCYWAEHDGEKHVWVKGPEQVVGKVTV